MVVGSRGGRPTRGPSHLTLFERVASQERRCRMEGMAPDWPRIATLATDFDFPASPLAAKRGQRPCQGLYHVEGSSEL